MEAPYPDKDKKILLDADVIRHFLKGGGIFDLPKIYPKRLAILDVVEQELCRSKSLVIPVTNFISFCKIEQIVFPNNTEIKMEFARLLKAGFGDGESACMAVARFNDQIIASSNLRDIKQYCEQHKIKYITTMDALLDAIKTGVMTEAACDTFITTVLSAGSKLPTATIKEYKEKFKKS